MVCPVWTGEPAKGLMQSCVMVTCAGRRRKDLDGQELKVLCSSSKDPILKKGREGEKKDGKKSGSGGK